MCMSACTYMHTTKSVQNYNKISTYANKLRKKRRTYSFLYTFSKKVTAAFM